MKLKEIIATSNWEAIRQVFLCNYPSQKKSIPGYEFVYKNRNLIFTNSFTKYTFANRLGLILTLVK